MLRLDLLQGGGARPARTATVISVDAETAALTELRQALSRDPREIPCKYLYDDRGSALFEQITGLPEYYPTRTERALLVAQAEAIGNDDDVDAVRLLLRVRNNLAAGDLLLLGANLVNDPAVIHRAYNDAAGVTAEFNRNILRNVNALAGSGFDPADFEHYAPYVVDRQRI